MDHFHDLQGWAEQRVSGWSALCFDLDGTLAEVNTRRLRLWWSLLRAPRVVGAIQPAVRTLRGHRFANLDAALTTAVSSGSGVPEAAAAPVVHRLLRQDWPATFHDATPLPAVRALMQAGRGQRLPMAVFSDHPALAKLRFMGHLDWDAVVDGHAIGALKPLPDGIHAVAAQLGVPPCRILMVGDREDTDGAAAAAAGAGFLCIAEPR